MKGTFLARLLQKRREQSIARKAKARPKAKGKAKANTESIPVVVEKEKQVEKVDKVSKDKVDKTGQLYRIPRVGIEQKSWPKECLHWLWYDNKEFAFIVKTRQEYATAH